ncbi:hypothetical protein MRX96_016267 [Rhipicephalus microplus]
METRGNAQTAKQHFFRVPASACTLVRQKQEKDETGQAVLWFRRPSSRLAAGTAGGPVSGPRSSALVEACQVKADEQRVGNGVTFISDRELCLRGAGRVDVTGDPEYAVYTEAAAGSGNARALYVFRHGQKRGGARANFDTRRTWNACTERYRQKRVKIARERSRAKKKKFLNAMSVLSLLRMSEGDLYSV